MNIKTRVLIMILIHNKTLILYLSRRFRKMRSQRRTLWRKKLLLDGQLSDPRVVPEGLPGGVTTRPSRTSLRESSYHLEEQISMHCLALPYMIRLVFTGHNFRK